ncbi:MAG: hypothetical protein FD189_2332, partial [Elusimicrobia bacterium]
MGRIIQYKMSMKFPVFPTQNEHETCFALKTGAIPS